jgi:hypothetical protein
MADGVAITAGSGTTVLTDDCGASGHAQGIKIAYSADGVATFVTVDANGIAHQGAVAHDAVVAGNPVLLGGYAKTDGVQTAVSADGDVARIAVDLNGRQWVRSVRNSTPITVASGGLTTASTAYTAGDQVGTMFAFASAVRVSAGSGVVRSICVEDKADITAQLDLVFFRSNITLAADNAAFAISDADGQDYLGTQPVIMADLGNNRFGSVQPYMAFDCAATTLYCAVITRVGHTFFGATTDLRILLNIEQD